MSRLELGYAYYCEDLRNDEKYQCGDCESIMTGRHLKESQARPRSKDLIECPSCGSECEMYLVEPEKS